jgi:hypothetical protein
MFLKNGSCVVGSGKTITLYLSEVFIKKIKLEDLKERYHLGDLAVYERILLKWITKEECGLD